MTLRRHPADRARRLIALLALVPALAVAACGGEEARSADNLVEAREQNTVELDGVRYRVNLFRQLNPRVAPDAAIYEAGGRPGRTGVYAAFLLVCNDDGERRIPTSEIVLEDAFGESFPRLDAASGFAYEPEPLSAGECLPEEDSPARRAAEGAAVLFEVPFDALGNRPFVLELHERGGDDVRRIELDL